MPKIKCRDLTMYYETHGSGTPIVFIAGFGADHTIWNSIVEAFKTQYQVILFDNRGAGQTDIPEGPYTIDEMADDVAALCKALNLHQAHFVGNSMGGFILQALAFHYPTLVKSAVISHSTSHVNTAFHHYVAAQLELLKANAPLSSLIKASCAWAFSFQFLSQPGMLNFLIQMGLDNPHPFTVKGYEGQFAALEQFDSRPWSNQIQTPSLILASDQDLIFSESSVKALTQQIPHVEYHCFINCGHLPHIEYPEQFSTRVQAFITKIEQLPDS
jgi:3-oxoadipate enol-lactonase